MSVIKNVDVVDMGYYVNISINIWDNFYLLICFLKDHAKFDLI
jgi:hypothetical protein